ncbi:MAG TPA: hypothetical protein VEZ70_06820 [Allosphingosinicella sp.]|nr:hypothetical protein [Allosphingosinicella sp.]
MNIAATATAAQFSRHRLYSPDEAAEIRQRLHELRHEWTPRSTSHNPPLFYTLGRSAALDASEEQDAQAEYYGKLPASNAVLREHFGDVLSRVQNCLEGIVGEPVWLYDRLAHPGFLLLFGEALGKKLSPPHFDMQYRTLRWHRPCDDWNAISFTLPVAIPRGGAALHTWDIGGKEYWDASQATGIALDDYIGGREPQVQHYEVGEVLVHHGVYLHRIAPIPETLPSDERLTLQGFAARIDGNWFMHF